MIIATAGHVDHGKTELVKALTGIDTDRLPEERARGLSVDLGFAYHILPDNTILGFVDVPGHEKFIRNMLAGVAGIDLGLLVVAADDGVMPQTREHVLLARQVGVPKLVVFLNKCDQVDDEELIELGKLDVLNWVETGAWGGLSLTFIISFFCLIFCFPIGMAFALGRRSGFPLIRYISIGFIEFWRGVPLITVLFMSAVMFPMFLPADFFIDKLVRCIIAISLFEAAYVAEVIRGGLQALPRGQYEAAKSLGMGYWRMHIFVILPQALKLVIPGIANTFLALVKDTPLIFVVGLLEIVGMLNLAKTNPEWLGFAMEGYVFAAIIFWIICYAMSKYSYNLEQKYKTDR